MYDVMIIFENVTILNNFVDKRNLILSGFSKEQAMIKIRTEDTCLVQSVSKSQFRESNRIIYFNIKEIKDPEE